jgi:biopolymer transport protein ExbD
MQTTASSGSHSASEPNVTPMLDVLLVLLIIFMSVTIQVHRSLDVVLPEPCVGACAAGEAIVLEVQPGPAYRVNQAPIPIQSLGERLSAIYRDRPNKTIQVAGYPGVTYQDVIRAMDVARASGARLVGISPKKGYSSPLIGKTGLTGY